MQIHNTEHNAADDLLTKPEFFKYRLVTEMQRADRLRSSFCLAVLNVTTPKIKSIAYPKDILTPHISKAIAKTIRNIDIASKDERGDFLILLTESTEDIAIMVIKRILDKLSFLSSEEVEVTISSGISNYPGDSDNSEELIQAAKYAMFQSRQKGKNAITTISSIRKGLSWKKETKDVLNTTKKKLNSIIESTIKSLLSTFATKDAYLEQHSLQVSKIAAALAENVGIKERHINEITLAALLHDVGYLDIPGNILHKKGTLTTEEFEIIRQHPIIAAEKILKPIQSFEKILPVIMDHHERWNGTGYPQKKSGRQIHIGARIISIADTYHALISDRPYRKAIDDTGEIIKTFQDGSGSIWEDQLTAAFIELLTDDKIAKYLIDRRI